MTKMFENAIKTVRPDGTEASQVIPFAYDMNLPDMAALAKMAKDGELFKALCLAFDFGFVMGNRATHSRKLRRL